MLKRSPQYVVPDPYLPDFPYHELVTGQTVAWAAASTAAIGVNNQAKYVPVAFPCECTLYSIRWQASNTTGNYDLGFYNSAFTRIASTGSTAMTAGLKTLTLPEIRVRAGELWYAAIALSSTSGSMIAYPSTVIYVPAAVGVLQEASALPLPATATPVTVASGVAVPIFTFGVR